MIIGETPVHTNPPIASLLHSTAFGLTESQSCYYTLIGTFCKDDAIIETTYFQLHISYGTPFVRWDSFSTHHNNERFYTTLVLDRALSNSC
jgi:hypothetical protein